MSEEIKKSVAAEPPFAERSVAAQREEKILEFWKENDVFKKTLEKDSPKGEFVFYEGPPTANGKPGIHHIEARAFKDAIPRYKTMQGYHVRRKGGWDTHGLPVELQVEKALGLNSKKAIEEYGIAKFNEKSKESVWEFLSLWEKFTDRMGFWVDQENPYVTYHNSYIESLWNVVKTVNDKGLIYKDYKVVPWCPRCGTALSSHELAQGYQDDKDLSVTAKFKVVGQENTYILAWTTTPWTLPGNVALAVGNDIEYVKVQKDSDVLILAEARMSALGEELEVLGKMKGSELVGLEYEPLYPFLKEQLPKEQSEQLAKAFKVYPADFVTTEDGTGVVHTAVMYGADDFELGTKLGLPKYHMVNLDGTFVSDMGFLEGRFVKDEEVAIDIIKDLAHRGLLFKKEKYEHSYPHCWRCKTPLIYYARDSWYIRMSDPKIKEELIEENKKINWEPSYIRDGRFGEWLKDLKDWAISRERYWGTPLPIWKTESGKIEVIGSIDELKAKTKKSGNKYFVMRHGGTEGNAAGVTSYKNQADDNLTEKGIAEVKKTAESLVDKKIDLLVVSPFTRTQETAQILAKELGLSIEQIIIDERLKEINPGDFDGKTWDDYHHYMYDSGPDWFTRMIPNGESLQLVQQRTGAALYDLEARYQNKNIVIVTHGGPAWLFFVNAGMHEPDDRTYHPEHLENTHAFVDTFKRFENAEVRELPFVPLPHNESYEVDLHRPYIDEVRLVSDEGEEMTRVKEVMDVWFDSGAMPFAQDHYPFDTKEVAFPADFISEAIDQTRGWFYTLHAVGILMGRGRAYKNVICLGHILDANGKKMSKSLGNIVDPWIMMDKYGVDTLRLWMYSVNQPGESKNFDEKTVAELHNKVFNLLYNVVSFYELYRDPECERIREPESTNVLDQWIWERFKQLAAYMTESMDNYKLLEPVRAMRDFIDDLSTWYVRRSRDRIKDGDIEAKQTLYVILNRFSTLLAPFAPFAAEDLWQRLAPKDGYDEMISVHLCAWPSGLKSENPDLLNSMEELRKLVTLGLESRQKSGIKVRQPLGKITVTGAKLAAAYEEILKDELNVKEVAYEEGEELTAFVDVTITSELKKEGDYRELVRSVQDMRKKEGLTPTDVITLTLPESAREIVSGFEDDLKKTVTARSLEFFGTEIVLKK